MKTKKPWVVRGCVFWRLFDVGERLKQALDEEVRRHGLSAGVGWASMHIRAGDLHGMNLTGGLPLWRNHPRFRNEPRHWDAMVDCARNLIGAGVGAAGTGAGLEATGTAHAQPAHANARRVYIATDSVAVRRYMVNRTDLDAVHQVAHPRHLERHVTNLSHPSGVDTYLETFVDVFMMAASSLFIMSDSGLSHMARGIGGVVKAYTPACTVDVGAGW